MKKQKAKTQKILTDKMQEMSEMTNLISNVGFPIAIAMYVLIRLEQSLRKNTEAIKELTIKIKSWK